MTVKAGNQVGSTELKGGLFGWACWVGLLRAFQADVKWAKVWRQGVMWCFGETEKPAAT